MNDIRVGRSLRALRLRKGLLQSELATIAGVSQSSISLVERGHLEHLSIGTLKRVFSALDAALDLSLSWRGGALDRILDARHAAIVDRATDRLVRDGWEVQVEVSFAEYGERGSIDILALRATDTAALVIEVKTELTAIDETIRRLDIKERLASRIVFARLGWRPRIVGRLLLIGEGRTARRRIADHESTFRSAFPDRGATVHAWLQEPSGRLSGIRFSSPMNAGGTRRATTPGHASRLPNTRQMTL